MGAAPSIAECQEKAAERFCLAFCADSADFSPYQVFSNTYSTILCMTVKPNAEFILACCIVNYFKNAGLGNCLQFICHNKLGSRLAMCWMRCPFICECWSVCLTTQALSFTRKLKGDPVVPVQIFNWNANWFFQIASH